MPLSPLFVLFTFPHSLLPASTHLSVFLTWADAAEWDMRNSSVILTWFVSYSCPVPLLPNHCKVNLLLHNWLFSRSCQFISLFTTCVYLFLHASTIYWVPPLGQILLHFGVTKSWPSRHFCSSGVERCLLRQLQLHLCGAWGKHRLLLGHRSRSPNPACGWENQGSLPGGDDSWSES